MQSAKSSLHLHDVFSAKIGRSCKGPKGNPFYMTPFQPPDSPASRMTITSTPAAARMALSSPIFLLFFAHLFVPL